MTDLEKLAVDTTHSINQYILQEEYSQDVSEIALYISGALQVTRREAIEEAAKTAESWGASEDEPTDPDVAFSCLAAAIRALVGGRLIEGEDAEQGESV